MGAYASGCSSGDAVAHVGGTAISKSALDHWSSIELTASGQAASGRGTHSQQALALLISADQLLGEAAAMHVTVSDKEVASRLSELEFDQARSFQFEPASRTASFTRLLGRARETRSDRLLLLKLDLLAGRIEGKLLSQAERSLSRAEIASYYAKHKQRYVLPERRDLEVIGDYERPTIMKAKREVEAGADFLTVAKRVTLDQEAPEGLELHLARGEEEPEYDKVVFSAKPGVLYGPYLQAFYYIFKVLKVTPPIQISLAHSEAKIRRQIAAARQQQIFGDFRHSMEQRWTARTDCRTGYVVPRCRQYVGTASAGQFW